MKMIYIFEKAVSHDIIWSDMEGFVFTKSL